MIKYTLYLLGFLSGFAIAATESKEFESKGLQSVVVDNSVGKVSVSATDSPLAKVTSTKNKFSDRCKMSIDRTGNKLIISVKKSISFGLEECDVNFQINVPKAINLDLAVGAGNISINGITGELILRTGSGNVSAEGQFAKLDCKSGSGDIAINGMVGGGELKVGSGNIDLTYTSSALVGELDIKTGSGNAKVVFPKGTKVKTNFKAGSGDLSNELGDSPNAPFKVSMKAGSGDLSVKATSVR